jgi:hypothetical protein
MWDLPSMRLKDRLSIPTQCSLLAARSSDGKYALCRLPSVQRRRTQLLGVVDTDTGLLVSSVPTFWIDLPQVLWLNDVQAFLVDRRRLIRVDCKHGDVLDDSRLDRSGPGRDPARCDWQPEQMLLSWVSRDSERGVYEACRLDVDTGLQTSEDIDLSQQTFRHYGAVPGGRWFYTADPGLVLIDRATLKVKARLPLGKGRIETLAFTANGNCLAVACTDTEEQAEAPWPKHLIRIHDTQTGRPLAAMPGAESIVQLRFSDDGRRLAAVHDDDTIEVWDLAGLVRR